MSCHEIIGLPALARAWADWLTFYPLVILTINWKGREGAYLAALPNYGMAPGDIYVSSRQRVAQWPTSG
jgi:hypothetical protein